MSSDEQENNPNPRDVIDNSSEFEDLENQTPRKTWHWIANLSWKNIGWLLAIAFFIFNLGVYWANYNDRSLQGAHNKPDMLISSGPKENESGNATNSEETNVGNNAQSGFNIDEYELIFEDEFDSGGTVSREKWNTSYPWGPYVLLQNEEHMYIDTGGMHASYQDSPIAIGNGKLVISATPTSKLLVPPLRPKKSHFVWEEFPEYQFNDSIDNDSGFKPQHVKYVSGIVTSRSSFNFTYGYVEIMAKFPVGRGLKASFSLLNQHYVGDIGEVDVVEFNGNIPNSVFHSYHHANYGKSQKTTSTPDYSSHIDNSISSFHTYGFAWTPASMIWYVNGEEVHRISEDHYKIVNMPMYLVVSLAVGGDDVGSPDDSTAFPAEFYVEYVRAYRKK